MNNALQAGLSARLKEETRVAHQRAERSGVMAELVAGRLTRSAYCSLLANLRAIYAALEAGLDAHPADPRLWRPELRRLPALAQDLARLQPEGWNGEAAPLPSAAAYVERLSALSQQSPGLLLAHAYLRYLGDLHGGQMLARVIGRQYGLAAGEGTAFYAFGAPAQVDALKRDFRAALDALPLSAAQADAFVAEACEGYRLHERLFEELQAANA